MRIVKAPVGIGFDASTYINPGAAAKFAGAGYQFVVRYVRRDQHVNERPSAGWPVSLSQVELEQLHDAGLGVTFVQFARFNGRNYLSKANGQYLGYAAAWNVKHLNVPEGATIWVDAEWSDSPPAGMVIAYLTAWGKAVAEAGYRPGIYNGYDGLTGEQWYNLPYFRAYWASAIKSINEPLPRGHCMWQGWEHSDRHTKHGRPNVFHCSVDTDFARYDNRGDRFYLAAA